MLLDNQLFLTIVRNTPLISIDLIIENDSQEILLGKRNNRPARGFWFVPGGRVQKNESLDDAFLRLSQNEIGLSFKRRDAEFVGVYEHFYTDSFLSDESSTHYVVLAYKIIVLAQNLSFPTEQHSEYCWLSKNTLITDDLVHSNTKAYFIKD
ncbi:TPA: GDP-mannose mannosyl hydrolase [Raoultella ornithinolytica]|uniref:GDP-mannose mannosyl hydrolase n=1 Tax=Raoultella ornithinolytica TaxID=54291 RepID=UPI002DE998A3|nr:GDP-mannose mannosyl hydrolase [Raoultella ornithinolytica]MEC5111095.1 GDP-mannose mannosyl hydrolase [Raoultella ornithinolytica]HCE8951668.1 GDP-mannose mannosyl hydrolase [Raoultella ornithinolytica]